jgi:hypothetical protein
MTRNKTARVNTKRHSRDCSVCAHPECEEIEREFCEWKPAEVIARERKISRAAFYRHIRAMSLLARRDRNIKASATSFVQVCLSAWQWPLVDTGLELCLSDTTSSQGAI